MDSSRAFAPRIYFLHPLLIGPFDAWPAHLDRAAAMGFDHVLIPPPFAPGRNGNVYVTADHQRLHPALGSDAPATAFLAKLAEAARARGLGVLMDLTVDKVAADSGLFADHPDWFDPPEDPGARLDPRQPPREPRTVSSNFGNHEGSTRQIAWWSERVAEWTDAGLAGFRCDAPDRVPTHVWRRLAAAARERQPGCRFLAWTPGIGRHALLALRASGFDSVFSSVRWWDYQSSWLVEEHAVLTSIAPPVAFPESPFGTRLAGDFSDRSDAATLERAYRRALRTSVAVGTGLLVPMGFETGASEPMSVRRGSPAEFELQRRAAPFDLSAELTRMNALSAASPTLRTVGELRALTGPGAPLAGLLRTAGPDARMAADAVLLTANASLLHPAAVIPAQLLDGVPGGFTRFSALDGEAAPTPGPLPAAALAPGETRLFSATREALVRLVAAPKRGARNGEKKAVIDAIAAPRVLIEHVTPSVDHGRFPAKRVVGEAVRIEADVFMDGHDKLAAVVLWRAADTTAWQEIPMVFDGNDRWSALLPLERMGRHEFTVEAWRDGYATLLDHLLKKRNVGQDVSLELEEARVFLEEAAARAEGAMAEALNAVHDAFEQADLAGRIELVLSAQTARVVADARQRQFATRHPVLLRIDAERAAARFASWYELFPRSMSNDTSRHGTFIDVIGRLDAVREMGFDVLYFPPIHPIGRLNRKGKNNSLTAGEGDVGSPYAIGAAEGGHDAIHPELGSFDDFRALMDAAHARGIELALDFAIQCAPDHPWLKEHPTWFAWRPDGTLRYAENPPKKYQDIVNPDFYAPDAIPGLWLALRDVILFWVDAGIRIFRVDNPHTKPLPFWEWMIEDVRGRHPDVIFLSEAFTRPRLMARLAKVGFSQSYSYFTWRETKRDFIEYLTELTQTDVKEYLRPNFFVNTPDINPRFLQSSGRAGFVIRAALAATLSGLWGVYSGFELCEAAALPNSEEYLDSEKYQLRDWDWTRPGNIIDEITALNRIRRANPALHNHLGVQFLSAANDRVLFFEKATRTRDNVVLVAINLDPFATQTAAIELPLWRWGLADHDALAAENQLTGERFEWRGKHQTVTLDPAAMAFAIWRVQPLTQQVL